jgi:hypothetical protein
MGVANESELSIPALKPELEVEVLEADTLGSVQVAPLKADAGLWPKGCELDAGVWRLNRPVQLAPDEKAAMIPDDKQRQRSCSAARVESGEGLQHALQEALRMRCRSAPPSRGWHLTGVGTFFGCTLGKMLLV